jgi:single-strand DNA-binding protein
MLLAEVVELTEKTPALVGDLIDNAVELRGRVSSAPVERALPSGALISTFRLSVPRARTAMTAGSSQTSDWVDCTAWSARVRRTVASWQEGDRVELTGALRRRFYRAGDGASTRLEVEVLTARRPRPPSGARPGDGAAP